MADSQLGYTPGSGAQVDTFTQSDGSHRQAVVLGDALAAATAKVTTSGALVTADSGRAVVSTLVAHSGRLTVGAAADAATGGRLWLINPLGSTVLLSLRRVEFVSAPTAATAFPSAPRFTVERVTFTGVAAGATVTPAQVDSTQTAAQGSLRTASTGLVLTAGATAYGFTVAPILTAVGAAVPAMQEWEPKDNAQLVLRPGQGVVLRQADAGTVADSRMVEVDLAWDEWV